MPLVGHQHFDIWPCGGHTSILNSPPQEWIYHQQSPMWPEMSLGNKSNPHLHPVQWLPCLGVECLNKSPPSALTASTHDIKRPGQTLWPPSGLCTNSYLFEKKWPFPRYHMETKCLTRIKESYLSSQFEAGTGHIAPTVGTQTGRWVLLRPGLLPSLYSGQDSSSWIVPPSFQMGLYTSIKPI